MKNTNLEKIQELLSKLPEKSLNVIYDLFLGDPALSRIKDILELYSILYAAAIGQDNLKSNAVVIVEDLSEIFYQIAILEQKSAGNDN